MENSMAMNGGEGPNSYFRNSKIQEKGIDRAKILLTRSIKDALELQNVRTFFIADLGCSVGPNTFKCVANMIEAVQCKYTNEGHDLKLPEFHVFFNDHVSNDFNTLFKSLPPDRQYMVAGVPGSFRGRILPKSSVNLMHSSYGIHWLSKVPEEVTREGSPLWNKGRITYTRSSRQIIEAFRNQFIMDLQAFFSARSEELVPGGLLAILTVCRPEGTPPSQGLGVELFQLLGDALNDLAIEGLITAGSVDSFNIPIFIPAASEVNEVLSTMKHLSIEKLEKIPSAMKFDSEEDIEHIVMLLRSTLEDYLVKHFGSHIIPLLFRRYHMKLKTFAKRPGFDSIPKAEGLFLLMKLSHASS